MAARQSRRSVRRLPRLTERRRRRNRKAIPIRLPTSICRASRLNIGKATLMAAPAFRERTARMRGASKATVNIAPAGSTATRCARSAESAALPMKPSASTTVPIRGLDYHLRTWGEADAPTLFMLHGWMDVGASFQFLVDALERNWHVIAPDWRGFGRSAWSPDGYWFADYLADLDALVDHFEPEKPTRLIGHSLGGNVVML